MKKAMIPLLGWACMSAAMPALAEDTLPQFRPGVSSDIEFPAIARATRPQGAFISARNIAFVAPGLRKSEVYTLLDVPHFSEGLFGVRRWNYILNFYTGTGNEYRQCQYQIRFDKHYRVEATWWREAPCADLFERALNSVRTPAPVQVYAMTPPPAAAEERVLKTYSFTFDFNKSNITSEGDRVIAEAAAEAAAGQYRRVVVTGFTDTVGGRDYNDALAARRAAATVADLTDGLQRAHSPMADKVFSRGGRDLAVPTDPGVREERNRRVIIEFY